MKDYVSFRSINMQADYDKVRSNISFVPETEGSLWRMNLLGLLRQW